MIASCYFWKWADNDLPGKPTEVHAALLRGELHPAIQPFDARPVLEAMETIRNYSPAGDRDEWDWCVVPAKEVRQAHFVFLNCPRSLDFKVMYHLFADLILRYDVSSFDESLGKMGDWFPPKLNEFQLGKWPGEMLYDITADELPILIKRISPKSPHPFAILTNRRTHFVQCFRTSDGYIVEWRENDIQDSGNFNHWRAQNIPKLATLRVPCQRTGNAAATNPDLLRFADALNIFRAFLLHQPRPQRYQWINTKD